jgi:hypothetical protein
MTLPSLLILTLATWRISSFLVVDGDNEPENGPFDIFAKIRNWVGVRYDEYSQPYGTNVISKAMTCLWCFSVWIGIGLTAMWLICPATTLIFCLPFALSAGAIGIKKLVEHG